MSNDKKSLIEKLSRQLQENADDSHLLLTAQMLVSALQLQATATKTSNVTVLSPISSASEEIVRKPEAVTEASSPEVKSEVIEDTTTLQNKNFEEKVAEETPSPTKKKKINHSKLIEKELSFFQTYKEEVPKKSIQQSLFEEVNNDNVTEINEKLKRNEKEIADTHPISDLKAAIGINDRYLYINELFRGDATVYERSILTINNFSSLKESMEWIERSLRLPYYWDEESKTVQQFYNTVKRRFS